jgi:hypothetical protein
MTRNLRTTESTLQPIRDTSSALPRIDPARVQEALGAEESAAGLVEAVARLTPYALREELIRDATPFSAFRGFTWRRPHRMLE